MGEHIPDRSANDWVERYEYTPFISSWLWNSGFSSSDVSSDLQRCRRVTETRVDIDEFVSPSFLVDPSWQPPSILKTFARELEMSSDMAERPLFLLYWAI